MNLFSCYFIYNNLFRRKTLSKGRYFVVPLRHQFQFICTFRNILYITISFSPILLIKDLYLAIRPIFLVTFLEFLVCNNIMFHVCVYLCGIVLSLLRSLPNHCSVSEVGLGIPHQIPPCQPGSEPAPASHQGQGSLGVSGHHHISNQYVEIPSMLVSQHDLLLLFPRVRAISLAPLASPIKLCSDIKFSISKFFLILQLPSSQFYARFFFSPLTTYPLLSMSNLRNVHQYRSNYDCSITIDTYNNVLVFLYSSKNMQFLICLEI